MDDHPDASPGPASQAQPPAMPATWTAATPAPPPAGIPPDRLERRAAGLLLLLAVLVVASVIYVLYARGAFEPTQRLVLVADDSEGVVVGMDLTFSGFPIGRVRRIELAPDGNARILIDVPRQDAHWLRTSSVFTLSRGLVGNTAIRAYSGILTDPPLPDGAERKVLAGDASAEIPRLVSAVRELVANLTTLTATDSALAGTLGHVRSLTGRLDERLADQRPLLQQLLGPDAAKLTATLDRTQQLLASIDALVRRADTRLLGEQGLVADAQGLLSGAQGAVRQLDALLGETRQSLKKVDSLLAEAEGVARNARVATADLGQLRAEVDASLRKVEQLVGEINRRWPFKRDPELKLP